MDNNWQSLERDAKLALLQELAPRYYEVFEWLPKSQVDEAIRDEAIAKYIQTRVNQLREKLSQANETYRELNKLRELALHTGEYCAAIEW